MTNINSKTRTVASVTAILLLAVLADAPAYASIVNGGFETGNLSGWSGSGPVSVVTSQPKNPEAGTWNPTGGNYFAYLSASTAGTYTLVSQAFAANIGDLLSFDTFFDAFDYMPFNDDGYVRLVDTNTLTSYLLYAQSVASVGDYGANGWTSVSFNIPVTGVYKIEGGIRNTGDGNLSSALGLDNVQLTTSAAVPEAASFAIWGFGGLAVLVGVRRFTPKSWY